VLRHYAEPRSYRLAGATIHDLGRPRGVPRQYAATLAAIRAHGPHDVLHAYWAMPSGLVASLVGRRLGIPTLVTHDSGEFVADDTAGYGLQRRVRHRLALAAVRRIATRHIVCSEYQAGLARSCGFAPVIVPLGVDTRSFQPPPARTNGPPWRLLHVASLNPVKDQQTLIDAFARVAARIHDVHLDIAGEDTLNGAIQAYAARAHVDRLITFHGFVPTDRLVPFYQAAHLLVMSSRHEAACVSVLEAGACGLPAVGTAVGYLADWSPDRAAAVPPGDARALADAVVELIEDKARRDRMADAARAWALAHDADWTASEMDRIYRDVLGAKGSEVLTV
jgi:glycosyltransferase involved in cell wall biosynthesis